MRKHKLIVDNCEQPDQRGQQWTRHATTRVPQGRRYHPTSLHQQRCENHWDDCAERVHYAVLSVVGSLRRLSWGRSQ